MSVLLVVSLALFININFFQNPFDHFTDSYPRGATNFLMTNHEKYQSDNLFNFYAWGGYLIHEYPEKKLFIDGRLPQKELKSHSYVEEYNLFFSADENKIKEKINEYQTTLFLLEKPREIKLRWLDKVLFRIKEENTNTKNNLISYLEKNNYNKVYEDEISVIYHQE